MKSVVEIKRNAQECIAIESQAIERLQERIGDHFVSIIKLLLNTDGRLIIAGIGKSANIASKMVATFNSTGQPSIFLHAADAIHGDLGNIQNGDVVMCISKSGNTAEIKSLLPIIKSMNVSLIGMTGNLESYLAKESTFVLDVSVEKEACPNNLAPTASTTAQLVMGDALAMSLLACKDFTDKDFARFHPGGILGKRLSLKLSDFLREDNNPQVTPETLIKNVIFEISSKRLGATAVIEGDDLVGIITDGDLRRMLELEDSISTLLAVDIMSKEPRTMDVECMAYDALKLMQENNISQIIVLENQKYAGIVHIHEIIKEDLI